MIQEQSIDKQMLNHQPLTHRRKICFALLVNLLIPVAGMSTDIYLPSLPALSVHFQTSKALVQLTVTAYVIAMGLSQLIAGPISDAYGRKKLLLTALAIQFIAVLAILFSPTVYWMIGFRLIQGVGAALMLVPARAILNDIFTGPELKKQFNYATICFALGPIIAPFIGGYLQDYFGWQANFIFILVYLVILLALCLLVYRETLIASRVFSITHLWKNYHIILSNKYFIFSALFIGVIWGYTSLFNVAGPFLVQTVMHKTAITYGRIALAMGIAWFIGNTANRVLFRFSKQSKTQIALWLTFFTTLFMLILVGWGYFGILTFAIPTFIIIMLSGFMFPIYVSEGLVLFPEMAASVNACLFAIVWILFGGFTVVATQLKIQSLLPLSLTYMGISLVSLLLYYSVIKKL